MIEFLDPGERRNTCLFDLNCPPADEIDDDCADVSSSQGPALDPQTLSLNPAYAQGSAHARGSDVTRPPLPHDHEFQLFKDLQIGEGQGVLQTNPMLSFPVHTNLSNSNALPSLPVWFDPPATPNLIGQLSTALVMTSLSKAVPIDKPNIPQPVINPSPSHTYLSNPPAISIGVPKSHPVPNPHPEPTLTHQPNLPIVGPFDKPNLAQQVKNPNRLNLGPCQGTAGGSFSARPQPNLSRKKGPKSGHIVDKGIGRSSWKRRKMGNDTGPQVGEAACFFYYQTTLRAFKGL